MTHFIVSSCYSFIFSALIFVPISSVITGRRWYMTLEKNCIPLFLGAVTGNLLVSMFS